MVPLHDSVRGAWAVIARNKVRSLLTMLGIIIGVMSVIVILSVGAGAQSLILNQIKSLGSNLVGVLPGKSDDNGPPASVFGIVVTTLKTDDMDAVMKAGNPHIVAATAYVRGSDTVSVGGNSIDFSFVGVSPDYPNVEDVTIAEGRFFGEDEDRSLLPVAVLGSQTAKDLFGQSDPIGQRVKIRRTNFTVIGVIAPRGVSGFQNQDSQILVPVSTAQKLLLGIDYVSFMRFKIDKAEEVPAAMETITATLRDRHNITNNEDDDFSVRSANQGLEAITNVTNALKFFLSAIAAISLVVGGIGIMNIMLAAVEERTREIGLRKALGATRSEITAQFLVETVLITVLGGFIGIAGGVLISVLISLVAKDMGYSWDLVISWQSIALGSAVSFGIGLAFGITPARRASALSPIAALRYE